uniref:cobalamin biosynthesis protein n=1 Tax=uncultured Ruthenibacterium sp. TaxID=1905347 RepID=UPI00349EC3ED
MQWMYDVRIAAAAFLGFALDIMWGDPSWMPHPVVLMGKAITALESFLRRIFPDTCNGQLVA